ncbi:transcription factor domain-containing protein [Aspergillus saccharolyticus JOP 1030-1]|uniref:C6 transcription factor n=1 Tax=Aspergillus saccharolyticus JOP 1030-1 TaxID=1450539 RepID=A0A318ZHQ6_9EURO|nr:C6 transcription factor [Aspergillus saccharolyticus JOP 1030-1]PYH45914.1 C6 transcription factor [Aspergillus saccharolyticus JOP 1030-1]
MTHGKAHRGLQHRSAEERANARRSMVACNRCRSRKTRCAGNPPFPCAACEDVGCDCVYSEAEKRVSITESYFRRLLSDAQAARQNSGRPPPPAASSTSGSKSFSMTPVETSLERDDWWYNGADNLLLNRSGEHQFIGASSATHLIKRLNPTSKNLASDVRPLYDDPSSLRRAISPALPQLPPFEYAKRLYWVQYSYIGTIFSLIQPEDYEERLHIVYYQTPDLLSRESCLVYCQVLLIISYGLLYSVNQWSGDDGPPGFKYFKHALRFLPDIHEEGSIFFVEVLCYVAYYMQNLNRRDAAFLYIGTALRMAISLGLHQEASDPAMSEEDRNRRRRSWWSVYSLDRLLSVKSGNPITIQDEDIGTTWPQPVNPSDVVPWPSVVLIYYTQLSRILGRIGEEIYRKKPRSGSNLLLSVQSIMDQLFDWLRRVPDRLRIDFSTLGTHINRESVSLFLHFYSCVNMTARPLVFYVIQRRLDAETAGSVTGDWKEGLSQNAVQVIESCISAARATIMIMDAASKQNLVATYGYLDGEYIFSAALLLVMVNAAFPHNEPNARSMATALNLLRGMADRGNTILEARHSLLLELQSTIGPIRAGNEASEDVQVLATPASTQKHTPSSSVVEPPVPTDQRAHNQDISFMQDISFDFDVNDDPGLWEEVLHQIDIDMDTDLIEQALRR